MKPAVKLWTIGAAALLGIGLMESQAMAVYFGRLTLKPGETQQIHIGGTARNLRVCNDFFSAGQAVVTIAGNPSHDLLPGVCAEDIGDRMTVQSHAPGQVMIEYRPVYDQGNGPFDED